MSSTEGRKPLELARAFRHLGPTRLSPPDFARVYAAAEEAELLARGRKRRLLRVLPAAACLAAALALFFTLGGMPPRRHYLPPTNQLSALSQLAESTLSPDEPLADDAGGLEHLVSEYLDRLWEETPTGLGTQSL